MTKITMTKSGGNVFADLSFSSDQAQNLQLRSKAMMAIAKWFEQSAITQAVAAKMLGITVPAVINDRVDLYHGQEELKVNELIEITHGLKNIDITDRIGLNFPILPRSHLSRPVGESDYAEERSRVVTGLIADYILPELRNL